NNIEHAKMEITESVALLYYLATKYGLDLEANVRAVYTKKLDMLNTKHDHAPRRPCRNHHDPERNFQGCGIQAQLRPSIWSNSRHNISLPHRRTSPHPQVSFYLLHLLSF